MSVSAAFLFVHWARNSRAHASCYAYDEAGHAVASCVCVCSRRMRYAFSSPYNMRCTRVDVGGGVDECAAVVSAATTAYS